MVQLYKTAKKPQFLSQDLTDFFRRRTLDFFGILLLLAAGALFLALVTYRASDPSWNTVSVGTYQNWLGEEGAWIADILWQTFGYQSLLLLALLARWGAFLVSPAGIFYIKTRVYFLPLMMAGCALGLEVFGNSVSGSYPGGALGLVMWKLLDALVGLVPLPIPTSLVALILGLSALGLFFYTLSIDWENWKTFFQRCRTISATIHAFISKVLSKNKKVEEPLIQSMAAAVSTPTSEYKTLEDILEPKPLVSMDPIVELEREVPIRHAKPAGSSTHSLPPVDLLEPAKENTKGVTNVQKQQLQESADALGRVLKEFGVEGEMGNVFPGPVVTLYEFKPAPGTKAARIIGLADDIARSVKAVSARISVIPGYNAMGIELPNPTRQTVYLAPLLQDKAYQQTSAALPLILGRNIGGDPVIVDITKMPHLLVAGTTGSGKSVAINTMILSLLYKMSPQECKFIMVDPKMLELSVYDGIPHLLSPVVTDPHKAVLALKWAVREMETRYQGMSRLGVRNLEGYNQRISEAKAKGERLTRNVQTGFDPATGQPMYEDQELQLEPLPYIVVIVDEMADLMLVAGKDIEGAVQRLAQMARAAGIHLIMATQRPSVDVITGTIKANFPTRVSFQVTSKIDSRTILGEQGAEQLLGQGDMLYMSTGGRIIRAHGPFVSDREVERVVQFLKSQGDPHYEMSVTQEDNPSFGMEMGSSGDALYDQALILVRRERKASTSFIQRHLQIGYNRAARIMERMEAEGVVGQANHVGKREILGNE
jgi:S-DNA-T family DNA segregation ATPase FtsK/SpoIIIE